MIKNKRYSDFKISIKNKVTTAVDAIHTALQNKNYIFNFLEKYEYEISKAGINFSKLKELNKNDINNSFYYNKEIVISSDIVLNSLIHVNLNNFVYLSSRKIEILLEYIEFLTFVYNMPYIVYNDLMKGFNKGIIDAILSNNTYNFGRGLSSVSIKRTQRSNKTKAVNWGESNKRKKELMATGRKEGLNKNWITYHTSKYYFFYYWNKSSCTIANHIYYNFKVTSFVNTPDRKINDYYKSVTNYAQIIDDDRIGNLQKLNAVMNFDKEFMLDYSYK